MEAGSNTPDDTKACAFTGAWVNGAWSTSDGLGAIDVLNPATGAKLGTISDGGAVQCKEALKAAQNASKTWGSSSIDMRAKHIAAWKAKLLEHKAEIVSLLTAETGKVTGNATYDFDMLVDCLSYHIEEVRRAYGTVFPSPDDSTLSYTRYSPVGVVVCVLTWNFPLLNLGYKLGPILATGCTAVIKPSELTPLATSRCIELMAECDFPPGVINCVNGTGIKTVETLCASPIPRLLTCIGSTVMGKRMIGYSATTIKRFSMELGGDAPVVVFADADLDKAIADIVGLKYANGGQICVSPNRVLVQKSVYEEFLTKAAEKAKAYVFGSGDDHKGRDDVCQPVATPEALKRLLDLVTDAKTKGARLVCGGDRVADKSGFFMQPTILADVTDDCTCQSAEIFGPILAVRSFEDADEAFTVANNSEWGLSGYVYTGSIATSLRAEKELECGNVCINGVHYSIELPHGGVKQSGSGKDISHLSLRDYYDIRRITMKR